MILFGVLLLWVLYSAIEGFREGFYWHFKSTSNDDNKFEIHPIFSAQRSIVLLLSGVISLNFLILWKSLIFVLGLMLIFSFLHNGVYYYTRNHINPKIYKLKWRDQSKTSTAKLTKIMNFTNRTIMFFIGVSIILLIFLI